MKKILLSLSMILAAPFCQAESVAPAPNGLVRPEGYKDWRVIAVSQRTESGTLRAILGNDAAVAAARAGKTNPWPDGAILAKASWKQTTHSKFPTAIVPGELTHVDFMVKDSAKYSATGGWGFARWLGEKAEPYGKNAEFAQECFGCHGAAKDADWVFTAPVKLP